MFPFCFQPRFRPSLLISTGGLDMGAPLNSAIVFDCKRSGRLNFVFLQGNIMCPFCLQDLKAHFPIFRLFCILQFLNFSLINLVIYFDKLNCASVLCLEFRGTPPKKNYESQSPRIVLARLKSTRYRKLLKVRFQVLSHSTCDYSQVMEVLSLNVKLSINADRLQAQLILYQNMIHEQIQLAVSCFK